jgi:hypothetical protein
MSNEKSGREADQENAEGEHQEGDQNEWVVVPTWGLFDQQPFPPPKRHRPDKHERAQLRWEKEEEELLLKAQSRPKRAKPKFRVPTESEQFAFLKDAVSRHGQRRHRRELPHYGRGRRSKLAALNPWAGAMWAKYLNAAVTEIEPAIDEFQVTIFDRQFDLDYRWMNEQELRSHLAANLPIYSGVVRKRFKGVPFLLQLDAAFHRLAGHDKSLLCLHWHGLAFGPEKKVAMALKQFPPGFGGARGGQKKRVYYREGALAYIAKDTRCGYVTIKPPDGEGGTAIHRREHLHGPQRLVLMNLFNEWAKPDLCIGSGLGSAVLKRAKQFVAARGYQPFDGTRPVADA